MYSNNHHFLIALGSNKNLGPLKPLDILKKTIAELKQSEISLLSLSRFFESPAYPKGKGSNFVNSAIKIQVACPPEEVLHKLHKIEENFQKRKIILNLKNSKNLRYLLINILRVFNL